MSGRHAQHLSMVSRRSEAEQVDRHWPEGRGLYRRRAGHAVLRLLRSRAMVLAAVLALGYIIGRLHN